MSIAHNIKRLREAHGLSQAELGEIAGVTDKAVSTWEKGIKVPRMGAVQKLSDYFGIPKSRILDEDVSESHILMQKKNDTLTDIVLRLRTDDKFLSVVEKLYKMDDERLSSLLGFLK